jgi:spore coat polysaccharide biosynthesis predicted glycosyltransferase SpsG
LAKTLVSLEDLGPGSRLADIVINDLYTDAYPKQSHWYGVQNAILAPQFELITPRAEVRPNVEHVLVTFGGTDPCDLTRKALAALQSLQFAGRVTVVLGPGYAHGAISTSEYNLQGEVLQAVANMAAVMREADVAVTSAGRTVTELMTLGIPTVVLCQNLRELRHSHASSPFGVINLGLGEHAGVDAVAQHLQLLLSDAALRREMQQRALRSVSKRSNRAIAQRILDAAGTRQMASEKR